MLTPPKLASQTFGRAASVAAAVLLACAPAEAPPTREVLVLRGSAYERGRQHGTAMKSKVRSFYGTLLASSILPNLNREQPDLGAVFKEYGKERYADGRFSFEVLLDNAKSMERSIPFDLRDEMRGIAEGAEMSYEQVLVLNTFVDSLLAIRSISGAAKNSSAPLLERVTVLGGIDSDGADNDGDGAIDEGDEADFDYQASAFATRVELPANAAFRFVLADKDGVDPATVRITLDGRLYESGDPALAMRALPGDETRLEVTLTPAAPLPAGGFAVLVQCGDRSVVEAPPPAHARFMRDERLTFTRAGTGHKPHEVDNRGVGVPGGKPPAYAFAARGAFTKDGAPVLAHQFALLDGNTAHKHTALFVHHPDSGESFAVVGWAGIVWGMSGMNAKGLAAACNPSDSLNNSVVRGLIEQIGDFDNAKLLATGQPVGMFLRRVLQHDGDVAAGVARAKDTKHTFGWACLLVDAAGAMRAVELDSDFNHNGGETDFGPGDIGPQGRAYASLGKDDLRVSSHFAKNRADMPDVVLAGQRIRAQASYSSFFHRSVQAFANIGEAMGAREGALDAQGAMEILRTPELFDPTDSMNSVVFEPASRTLWSAMGTVPSADAEFLPEVIHADE